MAARERKVSEKKLPAFRVTRNDDETEEQDLKKVKAKALQEIAEKQANEKEWYDNELDKNLGKL